MVIDSHTHIFPPAVAAERDRHVAADATFAELYGDPKAKLATAADLLHSMDEAAIDVSVATGFAWRDLESCRRHNDYLLDTAAINRGRLVAFCSLPLAAGSEAIVAEARRCIDGGARGFGELRPENLGADIEAADMAAALVEAGAEDRPLLFHVSEPVGHPYPGKRGLALDAFYRFVAAHPALRVIGAHWGGGLPFYGRMPEVVALPNVWYDTAASSLLYDEDIYGAGARLAGSDRILFGSDFPLLSQQRSRRRIEAAGLDAEDAELILGGNACRLLGLQ